ncbi:MAG: DUF4129 domain-containing protein [Leifsonia sp.]
MIPGSTHPAFDAPVEPGVDEARRWLVDELAKPEYQAARPTWFDQASQAVRDWFAGLFAGGGAGVDGVLPLIGLVLAIAAIAVAVIVFGLPRLNRRARTASDLFGDSDERSAAAIRQAAASAAASGDWALASIERFRAIARSASDRTLVSLHPGTTADDFARRAATPFPDSRQRLVEAARVFDAVRYLGASGSQADYEALTALDAELSAAKPATAEPVAAGVLPS